MDDDLAEILGRIEQKLDSIMDALMTKKGGAATGSAGNVKPSEQGSEEEVDETSDAGGRMACPECGSLKIKDMKDTKNVLRYSGGIPIYKTKHVCVQCGYEW